MFCPSCGNQLPDSAKFCVACGARIEAPPPGAPPPPPAPVSFAPPPPPPAAARTGHQRFRLQPLGFGQLFDLTIKLYVGNFKHLIGVVAVCMSPMLVVNMLYMSSMGTIMKKGAEQSPLALGRFGATAIVFMVFTIVCSTFQQGAITRIISDIYMNEEPSIKRSLRAAKSRFWTLLGGSFLYGLAIFGGFIFLVVPGIMLSVYFILYPMAAMLEGRGATAALSRSMDLVKGSWFKLAVTGFICMMVIGVVSSITSMPISLMSVRAANPTHMFSPGMAALQALNAAISYTVAPILNIALVLFYYDLRVRKEGFDLEMLAKEIG